MTRSILLLSLLLPLASLGCTDGACTAEAQPALEVTILDEDYDPFEGATVTYTLDGGAVQTCGTTGPDGMLTCGYEGSGDYVVMASAMGFEDNSIPAEVGSDGCDVETAGVVLVLLPAP